MPRWLVIAATVPLVSGGLVGLDLLVDPVRATGGEIALDLFEKVILVGAMVLVALLVSRTTNLERDTEALRNDIRHARDEGAAWRARSQQLMAGLSDAIGDQFAAWGLTNAEADIAGLMLKGLSLREIAGLRNTSEATIRQQAQGIYRKSGLSNRAQLSAYFLEDLYDVVGASQPTGHGAAPLN